MILTCPSCDARYNIDSAKLGRTGRRVRCASCGHVWHQPPVGEQAEPAPRELEPSQPARGDNNPAGPGGPDPRRSPGETAGYEPPPSQSSEAVVSPSQAGRVARPANAPGKETAPAKRGGGAAVLLWVLVLGSIAVTGLYIGRDRVVETWPPAYRLYEQLGIAVATPSSVAEPGLTVRRISSERLQGEGGSPARLVVTGELVNDSGFVRPTPRLMAILYDDSDRPLFDWTFGVERERLEPGESVRFATTLDNPDSSASRLEITVAANN